MIFKGSFFHGTRELTYAGMRAFVYVDYVRFVDYLLLFYEHLENSLNLGGFVSIHS